MKSVQQLHFFSRIEYALPIAKRNKNKEVEKQPKHQQRQWQQQQRHSIKIYELNLKSKSSSWKVFCVVCAKNTGRKKESRTFVYFPPSQWEFRFLTLKNLFATTCDKLEVYPRKKQQNARGKHDETIHWGWCYLRKFNFILEIKMVQLRIKIVCIWLVLYITRGFWCGLRRNQLKLYNVCVFLRNKNSESLRLNVATLKYC